jgi:hypothetical protein
MMMYHKQDVIDWVEERLTKEEDESKEDGSEE